MKSKAVVFACLLLFVSVVVTASAVSEGNQEQPHKVEVGKANPVEDSKQRCHHGCCHVVGHRCVRCCRSLAEAQANTNNNNNAQQEHEVEAWRGGGGGHGGWRGGGGHGGWRGGGGHGGGGN